MRSKVIAIKLNKSKQNFIPFNYNTLRDRARVPYFMEKKDPAIIINPFMCIQFFENADVYSLLIHFYKKICILNL